MFESFFADLLSLLVLFFLFFVFYCSCSSNIGRIGGRQVISVGSIGTEFSDRSCMTPTPYGSNVTITCTKGNILHEIGHALGYYHEHNRPDRDEYLTVVWKNVIPGNKTFTTYLRWYTSNITSFTSSKFRIIMIIGHLIPGGTNKLHEFHRKTFIHIACLWYY